MDEALGVACRVIDDRLGVGTQLFPIDTRLELRERNALGMAVGGRCNKRSGEPIIRFAMCFASGTKSACGTSTT
jgi:hypothetical protein